MAGWRVTGGPNFHEIPINTPVAQVHNNQRDGMHRQGLNPVRVAYEPNRYGQCSSAAWFNEHGSTERARTDYDRPLGAHIRRRDP